MPAISTSLVAWISIILGVVSIAVAGVAIALSWKFARTARKSSEAIENHVALIAENARLLEKALAEIRTQMGFLSGIATILDKVLDNLLSKTIDIIGKSHGELSKQLFKNQDRDNAMFDQWLGRLLETTKPISASESQSLTSKMQKLLQGKERVSTKDMKNAMLPTVNLVVKKAVQQGPALIEKALREEVAESLRTRGGKAVAEDLIEEVGSRTGVSQMELAVTIGRMRADGEVEYQGDLLRQTMIMLVIICGDPSG